MSNNSVTLDYTLMDLPTAQHKAGLAGLILHIRNLEKREIEPRPVIEELSAYRARIQFTKESLQCLFDDFYDSVWAEIKRKSAYPNKSPKCLDKSINQNGKEEKIYIYDEFQPSGNMLCYYLQTGKTSPWLKLWQDMLWSVLRAQPTTRNCYQCRADNKSVDLTDLWKNLKKISPLNKKSKRVTESLSGSIYIGAQNRNAEQVAFQGTIEQTLLLYFWPWVTPIFVPQHIGIKEGQREYRGFLLAIPEVVNLKDFIDLIAEYWQRLNPQTIGYRPAEALIDLPEEGGLEFLYHLAQQRIHRQEISEVLLAIELYHQERKGNNVRMLAAERLPADTNVLNGYARFRKYINNPLFKSLRIRNLIAGRHWHEQVQKFFTTYPGEFFIYTTKSPRFRFFGTDAKASFRKLIADLERLEKANMQESNPELIDDRLARRIYQLIGAYIRQRAESRSGLEVAKFTKNEKGYREYPQKYREAVQKVAMDAFLAMRGRHENDFIDYFTGTLCSVPHYFGKEDEFVEISQAIINTPVIVKNLAMLALSAHSWLPGITDETKTLTQEEKVNL